MRTAYVTLVCHGDGYIPGVEALGRSIIASGSVVLMVSLVTADVSAAGRSRLAAGGWQIREIEPLAPPEGAGKPLFPRFGSVFAKLRVWELIEFDKLVFLDGDTIVLRNVDDLFDRPEFAAAPDFLMPDRFNSGVMVLTPSLDTFAAMQDLLASVDSYDGGDQGFLNRFYAGWYAMPVEHRLPAGYNMVQFVFQFIHAHERLREALEHEAKILHYVVQKPWQTAVVTGGSTPWWRNYFIAHPEQDSLFRRRLHELEDWTFESVIRVFLG